MSNPVFSDNAWNEGLSHREAQVMTINGAVQKTGLLVAAVLIVFAFVWQQIQTTGSVFGLNPMAALMTGAIGGLVTVLLARFIQAATMPLAFVYAVFEGLFLAVISFILNAKYPGIAMEAALFTATTLGGMLVLYRTGVIKATPMFMKVVMGATVGLMLGVGLLMLLGLFGVGGGIRGLLSGNGPIGIVFSLFCAGLAAFNLVVDFAQIEQGEANRLPKRFEWVAALGLLVTLVWLYVEILILLSKLKRE